MEASFDFFERLQRDANERPNKIALQFIAGDRRDALTWQQLAGEVRRRGLQLSQILLSRTGTHVGLLIEDSPQWGVWFIGAWSAGCVVIPLDPSQEGATLAGIVAHGECEILIFSAKYTDATRQLRETNSGLILLEDSYSASGGDSQEAGGTPLPLVKRDPADDLAILYTGGTTGSPKGVRLTEANLFWSIWDMLAVCPVTADDHILSILPLFHIMPVLANLLGPLYVGAKVTYLASRDPARVLAAFDDEQITGLLCVPQFYYLLVRRIFERVDEQSRLKRFLFYRLLSLSGLLRRRMGIQAGRVLFRQIHDRFGAKFRLFGVGAASFAPEVAERMLDLGFNLFQAYGMTETAGPVAVDPPGPKGGLTCGPPLAHARIRIQDPDPEGTGEILIAGEHLTPGYWNDPEATAELIREGWLWSGDLGFLDASGKLRVTGRRKEVIVLSSGKNVFPEQVEYQLQKGSEFIRELCIIGCSAGNGSEERLHAVIVPDFERLRDRGVSNVQDQIRYDIENASRALPSWQRVRSFEICDTPLPRTSTRKLKRFEVRPRFANSGINTGSRTAIEAEPEVFTLIRRIRKNCGAISPESHLELDLGLDSLERVELFSNIHARFGREISDEQAGRIVTAGDLARIVETAEPTSRWQLGRLAGDSTRAPFAGANACSIAISQTEFPDGIRPVRRLPGRGIGGKIPFVHAGHRQRRNSANRLFYNLRESRKLSGCPADRRGSALSRFPQTVFFSARKYVRTPLQRGLARLMRGISIDAGAHASEALRIGAEGLRKGFVLCVFPEGHRSIDGSLLPFHLGPSILSIEMGVPIVPTGIVGTQKVWGRASRRIHLNPVEVRFGRRIEVSGNPTYEQLTQRLHQTISQLIDSQTGALS